MERLNCSVDSSLKEQFLKKAKSFGFSESTLLREVVKSYLKNTDTSLSLEVLQKDVHLTFIALVRTMAAAFGVTQDRGPEEINDLAKYLEGYLKDELKKIK